MKSSLWGLRPARWYRARVVIYSVSVLLVGWLLAARIGLLATAGWLAWVLSDRYWFHVWGRLGPTESYAVVAIAVWLWGIHLLWPVSVAGRRPRWRIAIGLVLFVAGNAVVVGAKENLLVLAAVNGVLAIVELRAGRAAGARWWACVAGIAVALAVAAPLGVYLARTGVDQYGRSVGLAARLDVLARGARQPTAVHVAFLAALAHALPVPRCPGRARPAPGHRDPRAAILRRVGRPRAERVVHHLTGVAVVGLALLNAEGLREQRAMADGWANATRDFTATMTRAAAVARAAPEVPVVVTSGRPLDIEHLLAVGRFLHALGSTNPLFLVLDWDPRRGAVGRARDASRPRSRDGLSRGRAGLRAPRAARRGGAVLQHRGRHGTARAVPQPGPALVSGGHSPGSRGRLI